MESRWTVSAREMRFFKRLSIFCLIFLLFGCSSTQKSVPDFNKTKSSGTDRLYLRALKQLNGGNYQTSSDLFGSLLNSDIREAKKEKALYYLALNYYYLGEKRKAGEILRRKSRHNSRTAELRNMLEIDSENESLKLAQIFVLPETDIEGYFRKIKSRGYMGVILRMFHNRGDRYHKAKTGENPPETGVYFKTERAPVIGDVLKEAAETAERLNLDLIAWFPTRKMDWLSGKRPDLREYRYQPDSERVVRGEGLDLFNPEVLKYLKGIYSDLAGYQIDGILLQDDLVLRKTCGWGPFARRKFREVSKEPLNPETVYGDSSGNNRIFRKWTQIKSERISGVINTVARSVKNTRSNTDIYMNIYYDSVLNPQNGKDWFGRDLKDILKNKMIDYFVIMAYHNQISRELKISEAKAIKKILTMRDNLLDSPVAKEKLIFKFQARDWENGKKISKSTLTSIAGKLNRDYNFSTAVAPYEDYEKRF